MDRLTAMEIFTNVVEFEGFSAAARHLGISRASVSKQVIQLEESLGARPLHRTT
ncbi:MAG: LysR family transcriptional regulator [Alphaproteobacteria bacterium]|nr:LysR family transcriptional regulator [Alphaproteobacteria bacterium]